MLIGFLFLQGAVGEGKAKVEGFGGFGHFNLGIGIPQIQELSSYLKDKGYGNLSNQFIVTGGSGYGVIKRVLIGGGSGRLLTQTLRNDSKTLQISGSYGFFNVGYLIFSNKRFNFYGIFGIGGGSIEFTLIENFSGGFDTLFVNPPKTAKFSSGSYALQLSLQGDISLYGLSLGLKMGYSYALGGGWEVWGKDVAGGPKANVGGIFFNLLIGGGFLF